MFTDDYYNEIFGDANPLLKEREAEQKAAQEAAQKAAQEAAQEAAQKNELLKKQYQAIQEKYHTELNDMSFVISVALIVSPAPLEVFAQQHIEFYLPMINLMTNLSIQIAATTTPPLTPLSTLENIERENNLLSQHIKAFELVIEKLLSYKLKKVEEKTMDLQADVSSERIQSTQHLSIRKFSEVMSQSPQQSQGSSKENNKKFKSCDI